MTINYQYSVATSSFFTFTKLLGKWRGSIYKLLYKELIVYTVAYAIISFTYRQLMNGYNRRLFEKVVMYFERTLDLIPLSFVLGFYVTFVVTRWWSQFLTIPWPDRLMNAVTMYIKGNDDRGRIIRRTLMRYVNLSFVLVSRSISIAVKKRFPSLNHLIEAGFLTEEEKQIYEDVNIDVNKHWIPITWFIRILDEARIEGRVLEGSPIKHILQELNKFRSKTGQMWCYDWVTVPLVYTQVVTIATHVFFVGCLVGRQYLDPFMEYKGYDVDLYIPFFTLCQFCFYMGWLKVAEQLINPYGEDDDDFEINWLIDRHIQVSYIGVDDLYDKVPKIEKDVYWDNDVDLPYTEASLVHKIPTYQGSTMHMIVEEDEPMFKSKEEQLYKRRNHSFIKSSLNPPTIKINGEKEPLKRGRFWSVDHTCDLNSMQLPPSWAQRSNMCSISDNNIENSMKAKLSDPNLGEETPKKARRKLGTSNSSGIEHLKEDQDFLQVPNDFNNKNPRSSQYGSKFVLVKLTESENENDDSKSD